MICRWAAVLCLLTLSAGCGGGEDAREKDYARGNAALLETLPLPEGASEIKTETEDYEPTSYATNARFRSAKGTTAKGLAGFYFERLRPRWRLVERSVYPQPNGNSIVILGFRQGDAGLWLNTADLYATGQFEVIVDHRAWENRGS